VVDKVPQFDAMAKFVSKRLPRLNSTLEKASVVVLCDEVLGGLLTRAEVNAFFQRAK
jgi:acetyl-CoA acetyltransferase